VAFWEDKGERFEIKHTELKHFDLYKQVMYIVSCAEICNNTNRYDGIKFGYRTRNYTGVGDLYINTRSEALGLPAKLAIIMGALVLSQDYYVPYYEKAMKIRRLIKESIVFTGAELIALPVWGDQASCDQPGLYALTALTGLPSITIPFEGGGIQLIADQKREDILYGAWKGGVES
jgi:aspartyl-tRNA(Asn)/glutamyl-tRNA(Gln) amidotransferase subunit A